MLEFIYLDVKTLIEVPLLNFPLRKSFLGLFMEIFILVGVNQWSWVVARTHKCHALYEC